MSLAVYLALLQFIVPLGVHLESKHARIKFNLLYCVDLLEVVIDKIVVAVKEHNVCRHHWIQKILELIHIILIVDLHNHLQSAIVKVLPWLHLCQCLNDHMVIVLYITAQLK